MSPLDVERINGLDTEALRGITDAVEHDPDCGRLRFSVGTRWLGGTRTESVTNPWQLGCNVQDRAFTIGTDGPSELLGGDTAPTPQEYLFTALNACVAASFVTACSAQGIQLTDLKVESSGELDLRGFLGLDEAVRAGNESIDCTVRIKGDGAPEQFQAIDAWVKRTSPNFCNLSAGVNLRTRLIIE